MPTLKELEEKFIKADDAALAGDKQAAEDAKVFASELRKMRENPEPPSLDQQEAEKRKAWPLSPRQLIQLQTDVKALPAAFMRAAPTAMAMANPPAGVASYLALAGMQGGAELQARQMEGKPELDREAIGAAAKSAVLAGTPAPIPRGAGSYTSLFNSRDLNVRDTVLGRVMGTFGQAAKVGAGLAATQAAADSVEKSIAEGRLATYDTSWDFLKSTALPAAVGSIAGFYGSRARSIADNREAYERGQDFAAKLGIEKPTLSMLGVVPAKFEMEIAASNPKIAEQYGRVYSDITKKFLANVGTAPGNEVLRTKLQPLVDDVTRLDDNLRQATTAYQMADARAAELAARTDLAPEAVAKLTKEIETEKLNLIGQRARAAYEMNMKVGDLVSNTDKARELTGTVRKLYEARSKISKGLLDETGLPMEEPLFPKEAIKERIKADMGQDSGLAGKAILDAVDNAGVDGKKTVFLSLKEFQNLRSRISESFAGLNPDMLDNAERLASRAYRAAGEVTKETIASNPQYGPDVLSKYENFLGFWRDTSQLRDSRLGRSILQQEDILDNTLESLATGVVKGNVDEIRQFKEFAGLITQHQPDVGNEAVSVMADAVKSALRAKHTKGGTLDYDSLLKDLSSVSEYSKDSRFPFPVEMLGFGAPKFIKDFRGVQRTFKPEEVTPEVIENTLNNPEVQKMFGVGNLSPSMKATVRKVTAQGIFRRMVQDEVLERTLGGKGLREARDAQEFAARQGIAKDQAEAIIQDVSANPFYEAILGAGPYKFTDEGAAAGGRGTVTHFLKSVGPEKAKRVMSTMREHNPQLADQVQSRVMADVLKDLTVVDRTTPENYTRLDLDKVIQFFNPLRGDYAGSQLAELEAVVSPEVLKRMKSGVTLMAEMQDGVRRGKYPSPQEFERLNTTLTLATSAPAGAGAGKPALYNALFRRFTDMIGNGYYNYQARMFADPDLARNTLDHNKGVADMLDDVPLQKAFMLMQDKLLMQDMGGLEDKPYWKGKKKPAPPPPAEPPKKTAQFEPGKRYRDAQGNLATYNGTEFTPIT